MPELAQLKTEAEIAHIQAQTAKLTAETKAARKSAGLWFVETIKVVGALILGAGGIMAAITGYQLTEVKKEKTELQIEKLNKEKTEAESEIEGFKKLLDDTDRLLEENTKKKNELDTAVLTTKRQLDSMHRELEGLQGQLAAAKQAAPPTADTAALDAAITRTTQIQADVTRAETQLYSAKATETIDARLAQLVESLFSDRAATRLAAYQTLTDKFARDPDAVTALLNYAREHMDNENGIYNTVVTLTDLSRAITQSRKDEIFEFCTQAEKGGEKIKKQTAALRKWLETKR